LRRGWTSLGDGDAGAEQQEVPDRSLRFDVVLLRTDERERSLAFGGGAFDVVLRQTKLSRDAPEVGLDHVRRFSGREQLLDAPRRLLPAPTGVGKERCGGHLGRGEDHLGGRG